MLKNNIKMKESLTIGALLALNSGFIDSYTFTFHDGRFASFQSGNMLQLGVNLAHGHWSHALIFLWPALAFLGGAILNQFIKRIHYVNTWQWEEFAVLAEALGIFATVFLELLHVPTPLTLSLLAICMAIQADTFTKLHGMTYATTMFTGNLKRLGSTIASYLMNHEPSELEHLKNLSLVIFSFIIGAVIASWIGQMLHGWTLLLPVLILLIINQTLKFDRVNEKNI